MAHFNPRACESYCCFQCSGRLFAFCGLYWETVGAVNARVIDSEDNVIATGLTGNVQDVAIGDYTLQVQCANGAEWTDADMATITEEIECTCCEVAERFSSVTISGLQSVPFGVRSLREEPIFRDLLPCLTLADSYTIPLFQASQFCNNTPVSGTLFPGYVHPECQTTGWIFWNPHSDCGSQYFFVDRDDVIAKSCRTVTVDSVQYWLALSFARLFVNVRKVEGSTSYSATLNVQYMTARSDMTGPTNIGSCFLSLADSSSACLQSFGILQLRPTPSSFCNRPNVFLDDQNPTIFLTVQ
jgi:hypothetical protein